VALTTYIILERVKALVASEAVAELASIQEALEGEEPSTNGAKIEAAPFDAFRKIGAENAHSTDQALRKAAEKHGGGYLVAVSERHWKGEEFEVETVTRVKAKSA
jgi:hypothetical protein